MAKPPPADAVETGLGVHWKDVKAVLNICPLSGNGSVGFEADLFPVTTEKRTESRRADVFSESRTAPGTL